MIKNIFSLSMYYGLFLREGRKTKKMTQERLAELVTARGHKISGAYISMIERGYDKTRDGSPTRVHKDFVTISADILELDTNEALERADYAHTGGSKMLDIGSRAQVKLGAPDLSPEDQVEIAEELAFAYEVIMARRKARQKKTVTPD